MTITQITFVMLGITKYPLFRRAVVALLLLATLVLPSAFLTPSGHAAAVVATLTVGRAPHAVAYDSSKGEIFVANQNDSNVSVISDMTNTTVATVTVGRAPSAIAYDSSMGEVFVANYNDSTVSVISDASNAVVATVNVGSGPSAMAYDSSKGEVYVANYLANTV